MNITHIITGLGRGGAENMLYKLILNQNYLNHTVISLTSGGVYENQLKDLGVNVYCLNLRSFFGFISAFFKIRKVKSKKQDVYMAWMYHSFIFSVFFGEPKKTIWNVRHSLDNLSSDKLLTRFIIKLCSMLSFFPRKITFNSFKSMEQHKKLGYSAFRCVRIPNGFNVPKRDNLDVSRSSQLRLVNVARFHPVKGHKDLILAFDYLVNNLGVDAVLDLFGVGVCESNFELNSLNTNTLSRINFLGESDRIQEQLFNYDVYVSCSLSEAFPNAVGEALFAGLYVVSTAVGDTKDIVQEHGVTCNVSDYKAIAKAIYSINPDSLSLNERNKRYVYMKENFSIEFVSEKFLSLYKDI
ncbi:glycosyltransferase [Grimontia hollisae]|uniref:glycosyltransferase n=1 Tax=Grimontia hollisae TaxID=673 RepID=UPI001303E84E|nr:glycosyltransferase [Grimontia hollisae]